MQARAFNNWIRTPLLLMAIVEAAILYSSLYVAGTLVYGSVAECERLMGSVALKSSLLAALSLVALIAMGLYQFHQRFYYREAVYFSYAPLIRTYFDGARWSTGRETARGASWTFGARRIGEDSRSSVELRRREIRSLAIAAKSC
jgi:hypothetical protein